MENPHDILDAPEVKKSARRIFTFIALAGVLVLAGSAALMKYYVSLFAGKFQGLAFLNIPEWVVLCLFLGGGVGLVGIIGSFVRREPGGWLRWVILIGIGLTLLFLATSVFN